MIFEYLTSKHFFQQEVEKLLEAGGNVNQRSQDGMTPLGIAAFWGYAEIVERLLQYG